ncbi:MAG: hypothetical protein K0S32_4589 [Bacteroidetes bacterium]|nr:hypothetical protein [Bacteroidota bacterium]
MSLQICKLFDHLTKWVLWFYREEFFCEFLRNLLRLLRETLGLKISPYLSPTQMNHIRRGSFSSAVINAHLDIVT